MNIYELSEDLQSIYEEVEANGGELTEELEQRLSVTNGQLEAKANDYCKFLQNLKSESESFKAEIDRLTARKRSIDNLYERTRQNLLNGLILSNTEKIKCGVFSLTVRSNESVMITDEDAIPDKYCEYAKKVSKSAIKEAIKAGEVVEGAEIVTNKSLIIR